jgi:GT2 family glycosyltransferase
MTSSVGAVVIGRNEGARLRRCLTSLAGQCDRIIYVDSGSTDDSVAFARGIGAVVVDLDTSVPFTAARARNEGFAALQSGGLTDYVQFVDGDCGVDPGWIAAARDTLDTHGDMGIVTGWRTETDPHRNVYHEMCEVEWHRPPGDIRSCGGDMLVRSDAFLQIGGFSPRIIASEDEEFCLRILALGLRVHRLPRIMTLHDADMTRFGQWWKRTVRSGHGFAEVGGMHPGHFLAERRRVWFYGGVLPVAMGVGLILGQWPLILGVVLLYVVNWLRTWHGLHRNGQPLAQSAHHAAYLTLSKIANMQGMLTYYLRRLRGADMHIIEYK